MVEGKEGKQMILGGIKMSFSIEAIEKLLYIAMWLRWFTIN